MQALPQEKKTKRKRPPFIMFTRSPEKLMKLNFNLLLMIFDYLKRVQMVQLVKVNKRFHKVIKEKTDFDLSYVQYMELACHNPDHCQIACGKRVHKDSCLKNFAQFYNENNQTDHNNNFISDDSNLPVLCFSCEKPYCKKCAKKNFVKCSGPLIRFINNRYRKLKNINCHHYQSTCQNSYCPNCIEKILKCEMCLSYFCRSCTFSAKCVECDRNICAYCYFRDYVYKGMKNASIICRSCRDKNCD